MLEQKILNDYKEAMKSRDSLKASVLSFLRAELMNVALAKKKSSLEDQDVLTAIRKQIKSRQDSIEQFTKGGREDLASKESQELLILETYLPPQLPAEKIKEVIEEVVKEIPAQGMKDMGKVMKEVSARIQGQADGKLVSDLVKERLLKA